MIRMNDRPLHFSGMPTEFAGLQRSLRGVAEE
jgi:hypothetical protein